MSTKTQVNTDAAQTLTNKTLVEPILSSASVTPIQPTRLGLLQAKQFVESLLAAVLPTGKRSYHTGARAHRQDFFSAMDSTSAARDLCQLIFGRRYHI